MVQQDDVIERTSIVTYALLEELHTVLADSAKPDETSLGVIMGLAMFLDDKIGPMRSQKLMTQAPGIILKTDAHVTDELMQRFAPVLRAFGTHLSAFATNAATVRPLTKVS
ncbi:hypothetical protein N825_06640 [Skermanella stibiiresistens SB22]|uniref:Uncharacterized protein n=1 Tax=Skermanella stibiiresistens SB22 TaxID=1385369 RepID=W9H3J9_9PROT|nr:hypothetical protein [Skermanella stibiiresistens]EWY39371.1 hypothetical protein N825_06640 [Skermanella stibiiresistens SB22]